MDVRLGVICVVIGSFLVSVFSSLCFYVFFLIRKGLLFLSQQRSCIVDCGQGMCGQGRGRTKGSDACAVVQIGNEFTNT